MGLSWDSFVYKVMIFIQNCKDSSEDEFLFLVSDRGLNVLLKVVKLTLLNLPFLQGKELEFYLRKIKSKKGNK